MPGLFYKKGLMPHFHDNLCYILFYHYDIIKSYSKQTVNIQSMVYFRSRFLKKKIKFEVCWVSSMLMVQTCQGG